jgi:hypothetical protein
MGPKEAQKRRSEGLGNMADLARVLGVSVNAVKKAIDGGRVSRRSDTWIDLAAAAAEFRASSTGPTNGNGGAVPAQYNDVTGEQLDGGTDGGESLASAKTRKERALADKAEVEAVRARAEVVPVADARQLWFAAGRTVRERMLALPDAMAGEMAWTPEQTARVRERVAQALGDLPEEMPQ